VGRRAPLVLLIAILALAAALRFTALGWGLRHTPHWDERVFVENARAMVVEHSLDHRYYEYPGLFFDLLAPIFALLPRRLLESPAAYAVARGLIAAFGVVSVALVSVLGTRLAGAWAGLAAGLLLAVSPLEVVTAHTVRPDVALEAFVLLGLLAFRRLGLETRGDVLAGAAVGAATAVKFTGVLLAPSYLLARALAPGPRLQRVLLAAAVAGLVAAVTTPYALLHAGAYLDGVRVQMDAHYRARAQAPSFSGQLAFYLGVLPWAFGPLGALLLAAGLVAAAREWRQWGPLVVHPFTTLAVLATAELHYERHLVPTAGVLALLAGRAVAHLAQRTRPLAAVLVLATAAFPLASSLDYLRGIAQPSTKDRALDWITDHVPEGARILTRVPDLGLDRERYEVLSEAQWEPAGRLMAREAELVVTPGLAPEAGSGLETLFASSSPDVHGGPPVLLQKAVPPPAYVPLSLAPAQLTASENSAALPALLDGRPETGWQTAELQRGDEWIEVDLGRPVRLARVELLLGERSGLFAQNLHLLVPGDRGDWRRILAVPGRPEVEEQRGEGRSQLLLCDPVETRRLRIAQVGRRRRPWAVAELRLAALP
jgi:hypothetical protein